MSNLVISQKAMALQNELELLEGENFYEKPHLAKNVFEYAEGMLIWKIRPANCKKIGERAGWTSGEGYRVIFYKKNQYQEHRLIFSMFFGPVKKSLEIDHINGIKDDNRIENLRAVSKHINQQNRAAHRGGRLVGASFNKEKRLWESNIQVNNKKHFLGYFKTAEQANFAHQKFCKDNNL